MTNTVVPESIADKAEVVHVSRGKWDVREKPELVLVPLVFILFTGTWELLVRIRNVQEIVLPAPSRIAQALVEQLSGAAFWANFRITLTETLLGFAIAAVVAVSLGTAVSQIKIVEKTVMPYAVAFQAIPKVALAPLFLLWFGFGMSSKIVMAAVISFFPILINVIEGLRSAEVERLRMLTVFGANKWQIFTKVRIPSAMPFIFAGLDIGLLLALLGAVVGEFIGGAGGGLGALVLQTNYNFDIPGQFAVLIVLSVMGLVFHGVVRFAQRKFAFWADNSHIVGT